ncbi:MAG: enolase-like domain-containing protein [Solirubrobacteraceae bacterium]
MTPVARAWERLRGLPLRIERCELEQLRVALSAEFERVTTVIHLHGDGFEGVGEDVVYDAVDHERLLAAGAPELRGEHTLESFSSALTQAQLFPQAPERDVSRRYRTWGFESAALDLALRLAGTPLHEALAIEPAPMRFVASVRLGEPPSLRPLLDRRAIDPAIRFKLDPTAGWDDAFVAELVALDLVDTVDLKGFYEGTIVDNPADPALYARVAEAFPDAWIEDPKLTPETEAALAPHIDRVTWDAPIHDVSDIVSLARKPRAINVKPSRIGRLCDLLAVYAHCEAEGIACYGGGQSELSHGRGQIEYLACLFHADAPNDVAPSAWNLSPPRRSLTPSPLAPAPSPTGFRWSD